MLDAAEMPPTFGTASEQVQGIIAGGYEALVRAREGAEDRPEVITGSTRLKAGTATKLVLNTLTTGVMILTGKVRGPVGA